MIVSFADKSTADIFNGEDTKEARSFPKEIWGIARRKLDMLNATHDIVDLTVPPGNRLKKLKGKFMQFYSIRINDQFRIIFQWKESNVKNVKITDYH
ncbi:MAG: type II toxin-antitoxin system RelE/ParE family toxin [Elusimicrobiota bacterium]